jgi:hypothetical protein
MKSFLPMTGVLLLFVLIGVGCAAQTGPAADGIYEKTLAEKTTDMDKPQYRENRPSEVSDNSKLDRVPMKAYVPGQVIVKFEKDLDEAQIGTLLTKYNLKIIKAMPLSDVYVVGIVSDESVAEVIEKLSKEASVSYIEPDHLMQTQ